MFLLPERLREFFQKKKKKKTQLVFSFDEDMALALHKVANDQGRTELEILGDFARRGRDQFFQEGELEARWDSLTWREREVVALACMGRSNDEIGVKLGITSATVKSHLKNIYYKYNMHNRRELSLAMKHWQFDEWWQRNHR